MQPIACTPVHSATPRRQYNALHCAALIDANLVLGAADTNLATVCAMLKVAPDLVCPLLPVLALKQQSNARIAIIGRI